MPRLKTFCLVLLFTGIGAAISSTSQAQLADQGLVGPRLGLFKNVQETRRDYKWDKPFQYQPSDPWYRGKVFQVHTGHYGFFYNCDGEECKRYSPYICWKVHHERDFPKWKRPLHYIQEDVAKIRRRLGNGGCDPQAPCGNCPTCNRRSYAGMGATGEVGSLAEKVQSTPGSKLPAARVANKEKAKR